MPEPKQFSKRAQQVLLLANQESKHAQCPHVASEHLLLGALAFRPSVASTALRRAGLTLQGIRAFLAQTGFSPEPATNGYASSMKMALSRSLQHSDALAHDEIEPEHLVLGILDEIDGGATKALKHFGVSPHTTKNYIVENFNERT